MRKPELPALALVCLACVLHARSDRQVHRPPAARPDQPAAPSFALAVAQRLEQLKAWDKAEDEYLKVDSGAPAADRQAALAGLARVHQQAQAEKRATALAAAEDLERSKHWSEAEQVYIGLIKSDHSAQKIAAERLERIEPRWYNLRWPEWFHQISLNVGRVLLALSIVGGVALLGRSIRDKRKTIEFQTFRASTDTAAEQIAFWLERVLSDLRSPVPSFPLTPTLTSSLPFIALPGFAEQMPDVDLEVGGTKIPFKAVYEFFARPRVRVSGNWYVGASGSALATLEKRRGFDQYVPFSSATRPISDTAGAAQDNDLQLFAYAVFIEAAKV